MWTWRIAPGLLRSPSGTLFAGYSGSGEHKNNPDSTPIQNLGPLPCGVYHIESPVDTPSHGPYVLRLRPDPGNEMYGRGGFLIHGDSKKAPGTASQGCIILGRAYREAIWKSDDHKLEVVSF